MKISVILKGKPDGQGRQVVYIRTSDGDTRTFRATMIKVLPKQLEDGKIVGHPQAGTFNNVLKKMVLETENRIATGQTEEPQTPEISFYDFAGKELQSWEKEKKDSTLGQYQAELTKLRKFEKKVTLADITPDFLERYRDYMKGIGNSSNTMWKTFKAIATLIRAAKKKKLIKEDPFEIFNAPKYRNPKKMYLTKEQVVRIDQFAKETLVLELSFCATWFVIGCYTGLRFSDMQNFSEKRNIREGRLIVHTVKTGEIVSMPVSEKLKELFTRVSYREMYYTNQAYNRLLKAIATLCEIDIPLTAHASRHTAAMIWANAGLSVEVVAKLLGHVDIKNTQIYFKISGSRIDDEMKRLGL